MGVYTDSICKDFDIVMQGLNICITEKMKIIALEILRLLPNNQARDFAISNLLESAEFVKISILIEGLMKAKKLDGQSS